MRYLRTALGGATLIAAEAAGMSRDPIRGEGIIRLDYKALQAVWNRRTV